MESAARLTDPALPEVRLEHAIARAELEMKASIRGTAAAWLGIYETLNEARAFPSLYVPEPFAGDADAAEFSVRGAALDLAVRMNTSAVAIRAHDTSVAVLLGRAKRVWSLFREGEISVANVRVVTDIVGSLPQNLWQPFEDAALANASEFPARFKTRMRAAREKLHADAIERHREAVLERRTWVDHDLDGMSNLGIHAAAVDITRAAANVDRLAREMAGFDGETRTLAQIRADVAIDLLSGKLEAGSGGGLTTGLLVPIMTMLDRSDEPGLLPGYGPVDAEKAREWAGKSRTVFRILTDPVSGDIRRVESPKYRPDAEMTRNVVMRDELCTAPGCGKRAEQCDIDHTIPWPTGATRYDNLKALCRDHHRVKHKTRWKTEQNSDGKTTWTSPTGFVREADPPPF